MKTIGDLLECAKAAQNLPSDRQLAFKIGVQPGRVYEWRSERRYPTSHQLLQLCNTANEIPAYWLFIVEARKAKTAKMAQDFLAAAAAVAL